MALSITTDFRHLPPEGTKGGPKALRERATFTREVVEAATSVVCVRWLTWVGCMERGPERVCGAYIRVDREENPHRIAWECCSCGTSGVITGFEGSASDFRQFIPRGRVVTWGFDDYECRVLLNATRHDVALWTIISRAMPADEADDELPLLSATVAELDTIYTLVEELNDATRNSELLELLDDLRASLCTAMDGF